MKITLNVNDWIRKHYPHLLSRLVADLEPHVTEIEAKRGVPKEGEMSIETVCLIISTTVPVLTLLYTILRDIKKDCDEAVNPRLTVMIDSTPWYLTSENDCLAAEAELKQLPEGAKIDLVIDHL